ncbi:hypothetical protein AbraIFM66950_000297 [Aspergillus brasiliensis]|nr:hypothetical protein AbraIFM66950_000297 [Aspergillus brasiliensis]
MPIARATIDNVVLAESPTWETVEGNVYVRSIPYSIPNETPPDNKPQSNQFPPTAIQDKSLFVSTDLSTYCPWKGDAAYYSVVIGGKSSSTSFDPTSSLKGIQEEQPMLIVWYTEKTIPNAAWYYPKPYDAASNIKDHVAFYTNKVNVSVEE